MKGLLDLPTTSRWRALALVGAAGLSLGALCVATQVSAFASAPLRDTVAVGGAIRAIRSELSAIERENESLRRDIAYSRSSQGLEQEARKRGLVLPGEVAINITLPDTPRVPTAAIAEAAPAPGVREFGHLTFAQRARLVIDACLAILGSRSQQP